jgi:hypothetical protein
LCTVVFDVSLKEEQDQKTDEADGQDDQKWRKRPFKQILLGWEACLNFLTEKSDNSPFDKIVSEPNF